MLVYCNVFHNPKRTINTKQLQPWNSVPPFLLVYRFHLHIHYENNVTEILCWHCTNIFIKVLTRFLRSHLHHPGSSAGMHLFHTNILLQSKRFCYMEKLLPHFFHCCIQWMSRKSFIVTICHKAVNQSKEKNKKSICQTKTLEVVTLLFSQVGSTCYVAK